ncbi:hypothetical protein PMAYCL1PPCAC_16621, partial [Pristionchus mayeri]
QMRNFPIEVRVALAISNPETENRPAVWARIRPEYHKSLSAKDGLSVLLFISDSTMLGIAGDIYRNAGIEFKTLNTLHHQVRIHANNLDASFASLYLPKTEKVR